MPTLPVTTDLTLLESSSSSSSTASTPTPVSDYEPHHPWSYGNDDEYYPVTPPSEHFESDGFLSQVPSSLDLHAGGDPPLVAVLGVGYVGEHLVGVFSTKYNVVGYDVSEARVRELQERYAKIDGLDCKVTFTTTASDLTRATHFLISVPTLLLPDKSIDSSFLRSALKAVGTYGRRGSVVVIESSVAVGMTRQLLGPLAQERGFLAGMSPERVDPGRTDPPPHTIPKIVSGLDDVVPGSLEAITQLYSAVFDTVVPVSRPEVAEMTKLYENCQRMMGIAFANEMADACLAHAVDPFEVCGAARTKPFGYLPFSPGLGVGGHCIPVNPYYLLSNSSFPLLEAATEKTRARPALIARRALEKLKVRVSSASGETAPRRPSILVVGMGFKPGQSHLSNSPGLELAKSLVLSNGADVWWADPLVKQEAVPQIPRLPEEEWTEESLQARFDMVIVGFRQIGLDFEVLGRLRGVQVEMWCS